MDLQPRVVLVTGGTRGLGRAIATAFAATGAAVVAASRSQAQPTFKTSDGDRIFHEHVDVTDHSSVCQFVRRVINSHGRVDVLVANAGVNHDSRLDTLAVDDWNQILSTNLSGTFHCIQAVAPQMRAQRSGCIITVSSSMATRPTYGTAAYAATKAAIEALTHVTALELARDGVRVNCIAPGILNQGMGDTVAGNPKLWEAYSRRIALGRPGDVDEVARAAVFLASDHASYITGEVLQVNGGLSWS